MLNFTKLTSLVVGALLPGALLASDAALIIGNGDYRSARDVRRGGLVVEAARELQDAGVNVVSGEDLRLRNTRDLLRQFGQFAGQADGLLVTLSGRFVHTSTDSYFLPTDADNPSLAELSGTTLPISVVLAMLSATPGDAVLVLATDGTNSPSGRFVKDGIGQIDVPQGVTVIEASPSGAADILLSVLAVPGANLRDGVARISGAQAYGYVPRSYAFIEDAAQNHGDTPTRADPEDAYWSAAQDLNTIDGYEAYVDRYPRGKYVDEARALIRDIRAEPGRLAEEREDRLGLNRDQRREIQRALTLLDFNTRGIDWIFGKGTRSAIAAWQGENGYDTSSYLTRDQIVELSRQAQKKSAQLEAEAEQRRIEQAREDRAYWRQTGAQGDEAGFRAYLQRYPDGRYSEIANARLEAIEAERRNTAAARERRFWDQVSEANTIEAYNSYLLQLPNGAFAEEAKSRIAALRRENEQSAEVRQAALIEERMRLNTATRRVIEQRLNVMGLKPGPIDGTFDKKTRRAIRRWQSERDFAVTGYLDEAAIVRILAESIFE